MSFAKDPLLSHPLRKLLMARHRYCFFSGSINNDHSVSQGKFKLNGHSVQ